MTTTTTSPDTGSLPRVGPKLSGLVTGAAPVLRTDTPILADLHAEFGRPGRGTWTAAHPLLKGADSGAVTARQDQNGAAA